MKIGIYSGCFDPLTNGHAWVIDAAKRLFDRFYLVIGPNHTKKALFSEKEREEMLGWFKDKSTTISTFFEGNKNIVEYITDLRGVLGSDSQYVLVRGIRDYIDFDYERCILNNIRRKYPAIQQIYLIPPEEYETISSSRIRKLCEEQRWSAVEELVPRGVAEKLKQKYGVMEEHLQRAIYLTSQSEHKIEMKDNFEDELEIMRGFFNKLLVNDFVSYNYEVTADQVRAMLDSFPVDVVVSKRFRLKKVNVDAITPTGGKYLPRSRSFGPIIVDANLVLGHQVYKQEAHKDVIIEGKHRWFAAKERGDKFIWAWVGERATSFATKIADYISL